MLLGDRGNEDASVSDGVLHVQFKFQHSGWDTNFTRLLALVQMSSVLRAGQESNSCAAVPRGCFSDDDDNCISILAHTQGGDWPRIRKFQIGVPYSLVADKREAVWGRTT